MISEQWQKATDTPSGVGSSVAVAALGNKIYVTGGMSWDHDKKNFCFARVDCYDTVTKSWSQVANMNTSKYRSSWSYKSVWEVVCHWRCISSTDDSLLL